MDLAVLQVFQTVANERSYSRAAEKLYRTQPAISIAMRKLEEWVGQPLFVKGSGAVSYTHLDVYKRQPLRLHIKSKRFS